MSGWNKRCILCGKMKHRTEPVTQNGVHMGHICHDCLKRLEGKKP